MGLVAGGKSKLRHEGPARDLYVAALFRARRDYVERTCDSWFILSSAHGLIRPDTVVVPDDVSLTLAPVVWREAWSAYVLASLGEEFGDLRGILFEIHAGRPYRDHGLVEGLLELGAQVDVPALGWPPARLLRFYAEHV